MKYIKTEYENKKEMFEILHKLETDGYIHSVRRDFQGKNVSVYSTTFDGRLFYLEGGYSAKSLRDAFDVQQQQLEINRLRTVDVQSLSNQKRLNILTLWLAIGTVALLLWQLFLYFYPVHKDYPLWFWQN